MSLTKHKKPKSLSESDIDSISKKNEIPISYDDKSIISWSMKQNEDKTFKGILSESKEFDSENEYKPIPFLNLKNKQRSAIFISAPSGAGKSTIARQIIDSYKLLLGKKQRVILFTQTEELDPVFKDLSVDSKGKIKSNFIHVCIKNDPMYHLIMPEDLSDSIVIFDDYENLPKDLGVFTLTFIKDLLERSRKMNIQIILINHQTQNYNKTRALIYECDSFVLFPSSNPNAVKKFLLSYGDIDKKEVSSIIESAMNPFDFLLFHKSVPRYILTKHKIKLI